MVTMAIEGSGGSEVLYEVAKDVFSIGASSSNDIVIRAPGVAPHHLTIQCKGDVFTFLGQSRQVAVLNGERRSRGVLRVGDRIRIGTATLVFKGADSGASSDVEFIEEAAREAPKDGAPPPPKREGRSEVVLYSEPSRLAAARNRIVEVFRSGVRSDLLPCLRLLLADVFPSRQGMLTRVDSSGRFAPLASQWTGDLPRLPLRTFAELGEGNRYALLRLGSRQLLIYPVLRGPLVSRAYFVVETNDDFQDDDELILAELCRTLAIHWDRIEQSGVLHERWETEARSAVEKMLPGTSQATQLLREAVVQASRSDHPVLLCGQEGVGRLTMASLIGSLHLAGALPIQVIQAQEGGDEALRTLFFGSGPELENPAERHEGSVLVLRSIHLASATVQREVAATILADVESGPGPRVRWVATTEEDAIQLLNDGRLDPALYSVFNHHVIRIPSLQNRREDLPLLILRLLDSVAAEQGKELKGIELGSLNSLLQHGFEGQMTELLSELRRLVTATPSGEMIRGIVPALHLASSLGESDDGSTTVGTLLGIDDLKTVVPAVERLIIDRVLKRTKGNQSEAARLLNLSRGALISKMKDYEIPDYRYLRRR